MNASTLCIYLFMYLYSIYCAFCASDGMIFQEGNVYACLLSEYPSFFLSYSLL